jgi:Protein of unknown function (DUF3631)/Toprim domain
VTAYERLVDALRGQGRDVKDTGHGKAQAQCPAHDDTHSSLSIGPRKDGKGVVVHCHAGCDTTEVMQAADLTMADLFDDPKTRSIYAPRRDYHYPGGRVVHRKPGKTFPQSGNKDHDHSLYGSDKITDATTTVYFVEGEKDCEAIEAAGGVAVCSAMGAGNAHKADLTPLRGKHVVIVADKDKAGRAHAHNVLVLLDGVAASAEIVEAKTGKDFADHFAAGYGLDDLVPIAPDEVELPDGAQLLDDVRDFKARFVAYPSEHALTAHTLWTAHTHLMDCWESTPRIGFLSPEPGSGKSRALEVTEPLVPNPVHTVNATSAYLFRKVSDPEGLPTILADEIDTVFGAKAKDNEDIRGMYNAGHRKGATAGRCIVRGKIIETEELPAYCAVAMAGLDDLPDTIMSRSVVIRMRRRAPSERVEPWRHRINTPEGNEIRSRLAAWADSVRAAAMGAFPEMPEGVTDRNADVWEPLLAVAGLAGGHWPQTARAAAVTLVTDSMGKAPSIGVQLLRDLRTIFNEHGADRLSTQLLLTELGGIEESPWAVIRRGEPLDARGLAQRLKKYGINPDVQRSDGQVLRGYTRGQLSDAWERYLEPLGESPKGSVTSVTSATHKFDSADLATAYMTSVTDTKDPTADDRAGLFDPPTNGEIRHCDCGNQLVTPEAITAGECKPCRDRRQAA